MPGLHSALSLVESLLIHHWVIYCNFIQQPGFLVLIPQTSFVERKPYQLSEYCNIQWLIFHWKWPTCVYGIMYLYSKESRPFKWCPGDGKMIRCDKSSTNYMHCHLCSENDSTGKSLPKAVSATSIVTIPNCASQHQYRSGKRITWTRHWLGNYENTPKLCLVLYNIAKRKYSPSGVAHKIL